MLMQRAVEVGAAGALLFVLWRALRSRKDAAEATARPAGVEEDRWIEMLAKARVEDLLKSDPARVGSILSRWAAEGEADKGKRRLQEAAR
jgi:hypothetical protein